MDGWLYVGMGNGWVVVCRYGEWMCGCSSMYVGMGNGCVVVVVCTVEVKIKFPFRIRRTLVVLSVG